MKRTDITPGTEYVYASYMPRRRPVYAGSDSALVERVTVVEMGTADNGGTANVIIEFSDRGTGTTRAVPTRSIICTWAEHADLLDKRLGYEREAAAERRRVADDIVRVAPAKVLAEGGLDFADLLSGRSITLSTHALRDLLHAVSERAHTDGINQAFNG